MENASRRSSLSVRTRCARRLTVVGRSPTVRRRSDRERSGDRLRLQGGELGVIDHALLLEGREALELLRGARGGAGGVPDVLAHLVLLRLGGISTVLGH